MTDILYISYQSLILVDSRHEFYCTFEQKKMIFFLCCYNSVQCQPSITEISEQLSQFSVICHGKPRNLDDFAVVSRGISPAAQNLAKFPAENCGHYLYGCCSVLDIYGHNQIVK